MGMWPGMWTMNVPVVSVKTKAAYDSFAIGYQQRFGEPIIGSPIQVGDPIPQSPSFLKLLRRSLAGMDDLIFRPIVEISPFILGAALGVGGALYFGLYGGIALSGGAAYLATKLAPGSYAARLLGGVALGSGVVTIISLGGMSRFPRLSIGTVSAAAGVGGSEISSLWFISPLAAALNAYFGLGY